MSARILLVEDEPGLVLTIADLLAEEGYETESAADGETGAARARSGVFDLLILDWMLPRKPGLEVCGELRKAGIDIPILMLTARSLPGDRVTGLKTGADDYLGKPFEPAELLARVEALLRRSRGKTVSSATTFQFGSVQVNYERSEVKRDGELVTMAAREFELLTYMIAHRARMITREEILQNVWKYSPDVSSRAIDVHIAWLRQKQRKTPNSPAHHYDAPPRLPIYGVSPASLPTLNTGRITNLQEKRSMNERSFYNMNRRLFTLLAATACSIFAQTPPAPPTPAQMAANMVAHIAVVLNLTTAQQASAITIFANAETTLAGIRANSRTAHDSLKAAIEANDTATIASVANQLGSLEAQQITVDATAHAAAYALLTADQKTKFAAIVGPGGLSGMGGPGHGPGPGGFGPPH